MDVFALFRNTDLTEGRGGSKPVGFFANRADAETASLGIDVQGTNGKVEEMHVHESFESWLEAAPEWERGRHLERLKKMRSNLDEVISTVEATHGTQQA